jgi:hypothetical protein
MKKFLALGYMLALPLVSGAKILPSVMFILFFSWHCHAAGIFALIGLAPALTGTSLSATSSRAFSRRREV